MKSRAEKYALFLSGSGFLSHCKTQEVCQILGIRWLQLGFLTHVPQGLVGQVRSWGNEAVCCYEAEMLKDPENRLRKVMLITKEKIELCAINVWNFKTCF